MIDKKVEELIEKVDKYQSKDDKIKILSIFTNKLRDAFSILSEASELWERCDALNDILINNNTKYPKEWKSFDEEIETMFAWVEDLELTKIFTFKDIANILEERYYKVVWLEDNTKFYYENLNCNKECGFVENNIESGKIEVYNKSGLIETYDSVADYVNKVEKQDRW